MKNLNYIRLNVRIQFLKYLLIVTHTFICLIDPLKCLIPLNHKYYDQIFCKCYILLLNSYWTCISVLKSQKLILRFKKYVKFVFTIHSHLWIHVFQGIMKYEWITVDKHTFIIQNPLHTEIVFTLLFVSSMQLYTWYSFCADFMEFCLQTLYVHLKTVFLLMQFIFQNWDLFK